MPRDMLEAGVLEPRPALERCLVNATGAATTLLRIDDVLVAPQTGADRGRAGQGEGDPGRDRQGGYPWAIGH